MADDLAKQHVVACLVCTLAHASAMQRAEELDVLGPVDDAPPEARDQFYAETLGLYCADGQRLMMVLGSAVLGEIVMT